MFMVVSKWEILPGKEQEFESIRQKMIGVMKSLPGIVFTKSFRTAEGSMSVIGYENKDVYNTLVNDPNGPFEKAAAEHNIESCARWAWSERGEVDSD